MDQRSKYLIGFLNEISAHWIKFVSRETCKSSWLGPVIAKKYCDVEIVVVLDFVSRETYNPDMVGGSIAGGLLKEMKSFFEKCIFS